MSDNYKDWKLSGTVEWVRTRERKKIKCPECNGTGEVGGGFNSLDDPEECSKCWGSKIISDPNDIWEEQPEVPKDLVAQLQKVWKEYFNR